MPLLDEARRVALAEIAERYGTPCFVYDETQIHDRVARVRDAFAGRFEISFAVKSNPNRAILRSLRGVVDRLDLSSGGELLLAEEAGWDASTWSFVGPAKRRAELALAVELGCGHIVVESARELRELDEVAAEAGTAASVLLRINPSNIPKGFGVSMARRPTIFGIDEEEVDDVVRAALGLEHAALRGFHVYAGTQCLDPGAIAENIRNIAAIFGRLIEQHELTVEHLVFGSGFGIRYHAGAEALDPSEVASGCVAALDELRARPGAASATMALEMGRYLVGEAGWFLARVLAKKHTRGSDLLALDGGMNHYLGASGNLGGVLKRNYPVEGVTGDPSSEGTYDLCGPLCTNIDALGKKVETRKLEIGDVVAIGCAGAYGLTSSPIHFISHAPPREILLPSVAATDAAVDITAEGPAINAPDWSRFTD
jgi:diaminopimelate decarboxylase